MIKYTFIILIIVSMMACDRSENQATTETQMNVEYLQLTEELLTTWTDAMVDLQIDQPSDPSIHGALRCPASDKIHGRCMDAVYPFMYMADKTGDEKYLNAAINVMKWSENVSMPDGSWTVIPDPKSWKGISVFGAIALAEALKYHGHILTPEKREEWTTRLEKVGEYIFDNFYMGFSHINYGITSIYGLHLLGEQLGKEEYISKAAQMAEEIPNWITSKDSLLFGEDSPADKRSAKGLNSVDLGYNVEETLNGAVLYALETENEALLRLLETVLSQHLEFMIPDGGWDNSWGTRQNKWSYWGSRTTDGCQPAYAMMADRNPAFGTAAFLNTELLQNCTVDGLLAGGLHYASHGVKPCVHHTFAHAKSLAYILDHNEKLPEITKNKALPRSSKVGIQHFEDIDVWIANRGPWTATISSYDNVFKTEGSNQATGGSLALLHHGSVGPLFAASMVKYKLAEKNNQQPQPGEEFATTPRIELFQGREWFTNLYDLNAEVEADDRNGIMDIKVKTKLKNFNRKEIGGLDSFEFNYKISKDSVVITLTKVPTDAFLTLPLISPSGENYEKISAREILINKPGAGVRMVSDATLTIKEMEGERIFNMVPGVEVIPIRIPIFKDDLIKVKITVE